MILRFNEIGNKYGRLTVFERAENYKNGSAQWYCLCDCGNPNKIKVRASALRDGHTKSCGCLVIETAKIVHTGKIVSFETKEKNSKALKGQIRLNTRSNIGKQFPERGKYNRGSLIVRKVNGIINNSKKRNLEFSISKEDAAIKLSQPCYYCGTESIIEKHKGCSGIDRLDNSKGYIEGNCVACCFFCNSFKNDRTLEDFKSHIEKLYINIFNKKD